MAQYLTRRQVLDCWEAYQLEPWGELREDYRNAAVRQTQIAVAPRGKGKAKVPTLDKLLLRFAPSGPTKSLAERWRELRLVHNTTERARRARRKPKG